MGQKSGKGAPKSPQSEEPVSENWLDRFPEVPLENRPRALYFNKPLLPLDALVLQTRGYAPTVTFTLPRRTDGENQLYLLAVAQGVEEGTISLREESQDMLETEMKSAGLLTNKTITTRVNVNVLQDGIQKVLAWGESRHTLHNNTTITGLSDLLLHGESSNADKAAGVKQLEAVLSEKQKKNLESIKTMRAKEEAAKVLEGKKPKKGSK